MQSQPEIKSKLTDSNRKVSQGGRAERFWIGKEVTRSKRYEADLSGQKMDQFHIVEKFKLNGFEYGNWVNNNDRYDFLEATAKSLSDLSRILGTKNIGCDGTIGIAFGARGQSKFAAHFEPSTFMINLTKLNGQGALAHEYGHALDYFFGMYVDQSKAYSSLVGGRSTQQYIVPIGGSLRKMAMEVVNLIIKNGSEKTETYQRWEKAFTDSDYWFRRNEIFARTFEQYIRAKMDAKKIRNTFLSQKKYASAAYLTPKDFKRISPLMDKLIKEMTSFMNNKKTSVSLRPKMKIASKKRK